jgi:negative regulator of flagellin synthesis FlgM
MKISDLGPLGSLLSSLLGNKLNEKSEISGKQANKVPESGDTIELSLAAQELQKLKKALGAVPGDVRPEKVEQIRKEIESGAYRVNSEQTAEKLLREHFLDTTL